jgi:hypothetical protein
VRPREGGRDRFAERRGSPHPIASVVPVAVVAAVGEQHVRRAPAEIVESIEERLTEVGAGPGAAAVEEDEQLATTSAAGGHDEYLVQVSMDEWAVDRKAHDGCATSARVAPSPVADAEPRSAGDEDDQPER